MSDNCSACKLLGKCTKHPNSNKTPTMMDICRGLGSPNARKKWMAIWESENNGPAYIPVKRVINPPKVANKPCCNNRIPGGVGTELKKLIAWFGIKPDSSCKCEQRAIQMDEAGIPWCELHFDQIIEWISEAASERKVIGFSLDKVPGFEFGIKTLLRRAIDNAKVEQRKALMSPFSYSPDDKPRFVTTCNLMQDCHRLASMLPEDTPYIIGIARSGLCAASMVAMLLHLPLKIYGQSKALLLDPGNGWRLSGNTGGNGKPVIIDDTVMTGNSFLSSLPVIKREIPEVLTAAVYLNPMAKLKPDFWAVELPWPHLLEWNLFNSILTPNMAVDFDGILCYDCQPHQDDDGEQYLEFLKTTKVLYPVRREPIPMIVTARLEKYRLQTTEWLHKHGIVVNELVMGPWGSNAERARNNIAAFKATHFKRFMNIRRQIQPPIFVESDINQARVIAEISRGIVVCPAAGRCF